MVITDGRLLNGRVVYRQPAEGFRSGIEPVLLAASVPVRPGERVLEAGSGSGATLICLHARAPEVRSVGVEVDPDMAELAASNAAANGFADMRIMNSAIESTALTERFDHAVANPPYHSTGTPSPSSVRERAKRAVGGLVSEWVSWLARHLRQSGTMTLIVPSGLIPTCLEAMIASDCQARILYPLWPKAGKSAKLVLLRGSKGSRSPMCLAQGLILHSPDGSFTEAAQAVLREGKALDLA